MNDAERKLVEALRSGRYKQTAGKLRDEAGYCCLGVACDISGLGEWGEGIGGQPYRYRMHDGTSQSAFLPSAVRNWLGWATSTGFLDNAALSTLNDVGRTFSEIADIIEAGRVLKAKGAASW